MRPGQQRNNLESKLDLAFLANLSRTMGDDFTETRATEMLNEMRAGVAREHALAMGSTPEEAEDAAVGAQLTRQAVNSQLSKVRRQVSAVSMVLLVEDQIRQLQADIDGSLETSVKIAHDIELSRRETQRVTRGKFKKPAAQGQVNAAGEELLRIVADLGIESTPDGERIATLVAETMAKPAIEPEELITTTKDGAASPALYARLAAERMIRQRLRQEMRGLYFSRGAMGDSQADSMKVVSPEIDREDLVRDLTAELHEMSPEQSGPLTAEGIKAQRDRTANVMQRIKAVGEIDKIAGEGKGGPFTIRVVELQNGSEVESELFPDS